MKEKQIWNRKNPVPACCFFSLLFGAGSWVFSLSRFLGGWGLVAFYFPAFYRAWLPDLMHMCLDSFLYDGSMAGENVPYQETYYF